ncbi:MAG: hypothetical protein IT462_11170 [Planctomycetes bacterium]|nr:hypothetical protein [Planctomycetota bacterium]
MRALKSKPKSRKPSSRKSLRRASSKSASRKRASLKSTSRSSGPGSRRTLKPRGDAYDRQEAGSPGKAATKTKLSSPGQRETAIVREAQESAELGKSHRSEYESKPRRSAGRKTASVRKRLMSKHAKSKAARSELKKSSKKEMQQAQRSGDNVPLKENMASKAISDVFSAKGAGREASRLNIFSGQVSRSRKASIDRSIQQREIGAISADAAKLRTLRGLPQKSSLPIDRENSRR